ncbi:MAG: hypothetical protein WC752_04040 [Patescibacteria group bacterium]|jgi:hypothetical protein
MSQHHQVISVTEIWYSTWKIFSSHFIKFLFVAAIPLIISSLFMWSTVGSFVVSLKTLPDPREIFSASSGFVYFSIIAFIIIIISQIWGAIAILVAAVYHKDIKLGTIFYKSLEYFWSFILLVLLTAVVITLGMVLSYIVITLIGALMGLVNLSYLKDYFALLNIVPALLSIFILFSLIFSPYFLIEAKVGAWQSMRKSYRLVKTYFFPIVIRLVIAYFIVYTLAFILKFIPYVGETLSVLLSVPLITIYTFVLYSDLKPKTEITNNAS